MTVTAPATGTLLNIVASTSSTLDSDPANNNGSLPAARVTTIVQERADVVTTKTGPATVMAAAQFSYTITTRNVGPSSAAAVVVSDTLPATVTFVSATGGGVRGGQRGDLAGDPEPGEWRGAELRRDGDGAGDRLLHQHRREHLGDA